MVSRTSRSVLLFVFLISIFIEPVTAVETFEVQQEQDSAFLPYRIKLLREIPANPAAHKTNAVAKLLHSRHRDSSVAYFLGMNIPEAWQDQTMNIDVLSFPPAKLLLQAAVRMIPYRWSLYTDSVSGYQTAVVCGYHGDSAYVLQYDPKTAEYERRCLQTGEDGTGNGRWEPTVKCPLIEDYDFDGRVEAFVHVAPVRDKGERTLYCVELGTLEVEWSLPLALNYYEGRNMYRLPDTSDPGIIFLAKGARQGHKDEHYDELFGYVSIIDSSGNVRYNRIVQHAPVGPRMIANAGHTRFYTSHEFEPVDPVYTDSLIREVENRTISDGSARISVIDTSGAFLHSIRVSTYPTTLWLMPWQEYESCLYVYHEDKRIRVYDSTLNLLAESGPLDSRLGDFVGPVSLEGVPDALLFSGGVYTRDFEQLANFEGLWVPSPMTYDSTGNVTELLLTGSTAARFVAIARRSWGDLLVILYFRYRMYIMVVLTGLLVGLIVTNFYRARTRRNLMVISQQKEQLERAQEALREAQAQLVAQEKFRQARDIAGGFAHEIRNALSPVRNALARLGTIKPEEATEEQLARLRGLIDRSVTRAVDLTRRISEYTHLEQPKQREAVDLAQVIRRAVEQQRDRIDDWGVTLTLPEECPGPVVGDSTQYELVFSNLISNAVDAVEGIDGSRLAVACREVGDFVEISVTDNGCGIAPEDLDRVFDFFYSTKPETGSGLGLAIVKKTVELHGGAVLVKSKPGGGSVFRVRLPKAGN